MNLILLLGALLGLTSVMMAAFVDHVLALHLSGKVLNQVLTAVRYHQFYAFFISVVGMYLHLQTHVRYKKWLLFVASLFIIGTICFSFSIYLSAIFNILWVLHLAPLGGLLFMLGWASLMRIAFLKNS